MTSWSYFWKQSFPIFQWRVALLSLYCARCFNRCPCHMLQQWPLQADRALDQPRFTSLMKPSHRLEKHLQYTDMLMQLYLRAKLTMFWLTLKRLDVLMPGCPEKQKLCFLCPVGLKEENLFTKAWKYFITSSRGRSVLMTWSTGLWLAAGFLKLQRAHWSACQPLGQQWDETDKIIVSNETQIHRPVWTWTIRALFSLFAFSPFFCVLFFFEGGVPYWSWIWRETVEANSNQSWCTSPGGALIPFEVLQVNTAQSACWTRLPWQP